MNIPIYTSSQWASSPSVSSDSYSSLTPSSSSSSSSAKAARNSAPDCCRSRADIPGLGEESCRVGARAEADQAGLASSGLGAGRFVGASTGSLRSAGVVVGMEIFPKPNMRGLRMGALPLGSDPKLNAGVGGGRLTGGARDPREDAAAVEEKVISGERLIGTDFECCLVLLPLKRFSASADGDGET
ncbi:hypothetical protein BS47DRAFT_918075 [Hydnum rufescens UP504]|uniref:Uncharacterized protein n=1 Tax=Hydnum rufescens UP504 TaxID=1448309 RepID=A0A9P6BAL9_9AGAM|nr:hypothetical protein BS47DRAFT_918075 [Hydnum rufescens UP504]